MKRIIVFAAILGILVAFSCKKSTSSRGDNFTRADSLTERYLNLQDSMLHAWNVLIRDEKEKIDAIHELVNKLQLDPNSHPDELEALNQRIGQLERIRFTQKSLGNPYVIDEYDFAAGSIISEVLSLAEISPITINNPSLQRLVDQIKLADQRVTQYRSEYDKIVARYNQFIERNKRELDQIDAEVEDGKKPLFRATAEQD